MTETDRSKFAARGVIQSASNPAQRLFAPNGYQPLRWQRADWLAIGVLIGLCLVYFWPLVTPDLRQRLYIVSGDFTNQFYPYHFFAAAEWWSHRIPLWNPYLFGGHPFQADIQTAVFYPLGLLVNLIAGRNGLPFEALEWQGIVDYLLAGLFTFLFLRSVVRDRVASLLGGALFALGGYLTSYPFQQLAMLESAVWLPLILLLIETALRQPSQRFVWWLTAGLAMATAVLAGHPQTALYILYLASAYILWRSRSYGLGWKDAVKGLMAFGFAGIAGAAVQLWPSIEFTLLSTRAAIDYSAAGQGYDLVALPGLLMPEWRSEKALYLGVAPLLLAMAALRGGPRREVWFWGVVGLVALALSFGDSGLLYRLFHAVLPGFSTFRGQERSAFLFSFSGAMLAGYGIACIRSRALALSGRTLAAIALALVATSASALAFFWAQNDALVGGSRIEDVGYGKFVVLLATASGCYWLATRAISRQAPPKNSLPALATLGLVLLSVGDVVSANWQNNMSPVKPTISTAQEAVVDFLAREQDSLGEPLRVRPQNSEALPSNYGSVVRVPFAAGDSPIVVQRTQNVFGSGEEWRMWQLLNVKYVASFGQPTDALEEVLSVPPLKIYRNRFSLPRAWVVEDVVIAESAQQAKETVLRADLHPGKTAVVESALQLDVKAARSDEVPLKQEIKFDFYDPRRLYLHASTNRNGLLVLSEMYYPGWQAKLNDRPVPILPVDYILRGIELPAGEHRLEMVYNPLSFWLGLAISGATVLAVGACWCWRFRRKSGK